MGISFDRRKEKAWKHRIPRSPQQHHPDGPLRGQRNFSPTSHTFALDGRGHQPINSIFGAWKITTLPLSEEATILSFTVIASLSLYSFLPESHICRYYSLDFPVDSNFVSLNLQPPHHHFFCFLFHTVHLLKKLDCLTCPNLPECRFCWLFTHGVVPCDPLHFLHVGR